MKNAYIISRIYEDGNDEEYLGVCLDQDLAKKFMEDHKAKEPMMNYEYYIDTAPLVE